MILESHASEADASRGRVAFLRTKDADDSFDTDLHSEVFEEAMFVDDFRGKEETEHAGIMTSFNAAFAKRIYR
ncbi:MAG: hypothetical protein C4523_19510 [Myxococcales bacterium]|nr:MAG: hypothetical protein C4523_19510 [Myxococcales bacterium]